MHDDPNAGGLAMNIYDFASVMYLPIFLIAYTLAYVFKKKGKVRLATQIILFMCGGDIALWFMGLALIESVCNGQFACHK